jgi:hypothetical protein
LTRNSHDQHREAKQANKSINELATRAFCQQTKELLVSLLNEANAEVLEAHNSNAGQALLGGQDVLPFSATVGMFKGDGPEDDMREEIAEGPSKKSRRMIKAVDRLNMVAYNEEPYEGNDEGSNYSTNGEDTGSDTEEDDHLDTTAEFSSIQPDALKQLQKIYKQHNQDIREAFHQEELNLRLLLSLRPDRVYTTIDLQEQHILDRALRLLFSRRVGSATHSVRLGPHIDYTLLPQKIIEKVSSKTYSLPDVSETRLLGKRNSR